MACHLRCNIEINTEVTLPPALRLTKKIITHLAWGLLQPRYLIIHLQEVLWSEMMTNHLSYMIYGHFSIIENISRDTGPTLWPLVWPLLLSLLQDHFTLYLTPFIELVLSLFSQARKYYIFILTSLIMISWDDNVNFRQSNLLNYWN